VSRVVALSPVGEAGGAENLVLDILRQLQGRGHEVELLAAGPGPLVALARTRAIQAQALPALDLRSPRSVLRCALALRAACGPAAGTSLLLNHPKAHLIATVAGVTIRRPSLLQLYDAAVDSNSIDKLSARLPVRRVAISEQTASAYAAAVRPHRSQVVGGRCQIPVVRPAVDLSDVQLRASRGDASAAFACAGLRPGRLDIVMVARLQRFKGPESFIRLAARLAAQDPDSRAMIIGPDSPAEPGLRQQLQEQIDATGLTGVVALAGYLSDDDLAALVGRSKLLVHAADAETFGLVLVEAMCLGTPVVAYSSNGPDEVLAEGGGVIVPCRDETALADTVQRLLGDSARLDELSSAARVCASRFDAGGLASSYEYLLSATQRDKPGPLPTGR
jgi:glycosyltransferase involved in cell wall biosynthesis